MSMDVLLGRNSCKSLALDELVANSGCVVLTGTIVELFGSSAAVHGELDQCHAIAGL